MQYILLYIFGASPARSIMLAVSALVAEEFLLLLRSLHAVPQCGACVRVHEAPGGFPGVATGGHTTIKKPASWTGFAVYSSGIVT